MNQEAFCVLPEADRVLILVNPKAGRRSVLGHVDALAQLLRQRDFHVEVMDQLSEVADQADRLHERGQLRALVGVGGDGTAAELANRTRPGVPLALLPAGTANLLARHFGLPTDPEKLADVIAAGTCRRIDAGLAGGRVFLLMASCGFDAEVVRRVHAARLAAKHGSHIRYASYLKPIWQSIRNYEYPQIRVYFDKGVSGGPLDGAADSLVARWVFVSNLPRYGWGLNLAPQADCSDGLLDVSTFRRGSLGHGLRYLVAVQLGAWHGRLSDCAIRQARRIRIDCEKPVAYQLDGDPGGQLPLDIEVLPDRLTLVVPSAGE